MVNYAQGRRNSGFAWCAFLIFDGDLEPYTASFDDLGVLPEIIAHAISVRIATIRSVLLEWNDE